jgi:hypothetical protein
MVYLKLQPYIQTSVAPRSNQKLSFKYFGPYKILQKVGNAAYKLELPRDAKIHSVVHVSLLKKHVSQSAVVSSDLAMLQFNEELKPLKFLDDRLIRKGSSTLHQVKVQWTHLTLQFISWKKVFDLRRRYPDAPAWGQAGFQGVGIVRKQRKTKERSNK